MLLCSSSMPQPCTFLEPASRSKRARMLWNLIANEIDAMRDIDTNADKHKEADPRSYDLMSCLWRSTSRHLREMKSVAERSQLKIDKAEIVLTLPG